MGGTILGVSLRFNMSCDNKSSHLVPRPIIELDCFCDHMRTSVHMIRQIWIVLILFGEGWFFLCALRLGDG